MATYYVVMAGELPTSASAFGTRRAAEKAARKVRSDWATSTRVLLRCDHRFNQNGPDSERHMSLHYRRVIEFPYKSR